MSRRTDVIHLLDEAHGKIVAASVRSDGRVLSDAQYRTILACQKRIKQIVSALDKKPDA